jgi:hypothetical protein
MQHSSCLHMTHVCVPRHKRSIGIPTLRPASLLQVPSAASSNGDPTALTAATPAAAAATANSRAPAQRGYLLLRRYATASWSSPGVTMLTAPAATAAASSRCIQSHGSIKAAGQESHWGTLETMHTGGVMGMSVTSPSCSSKCSSRTTPWITSVYMWTGSSTRGS